MSSVSRISAITFCKAGVSMKSSTCARFSSWFRLLPTFRTSTISCDTTQNLTNVSFARHTGQAHFFGKVGILILGKVNFYSFVSFPHDHSFLCGVSGVQNPGQADLHKQIQCLLRQCHTLTPALVISSADGEFYLLNGGRVPPSRLLQQLG